MLDYKILKEVPYESRMLCLINKDDRLVILHLKGETTIKDFGYFEDTGHEFVIDPENLMYDTEYLNNSIKKRFIKVEEVHPMSLSGVCEATQWMKVKSINRVFDVSFTEVEF